MKKNIFIVLILISHNLLSQDFKNKFVNYVKYDNPNVVNLYNYIYCSDTILVVDTTSISGNITLINRTLINHYICDSILVSSDTLAAFVRKDMCDVNSNWIIDDAEKLGANPPGYYLDRSNHTGTQPSSTITDLEEKIEDQIGSKIKQGTGISISYNDNNGETTISASGSNKQIFVLDNSFSNNSTTHTDVTGWNFNIEAGGVYRVEILGQSTTAAATTGVSPRWYLNSGAGKLMNQMRFQVGTNNSTSSVVHGSNFVTMVNPGGYGGMTTTGAANTNTGYSMMTFTAIINCTSTGSMKFQWASEIAGSSVTLEAGSIMIVERLN